MTVKQRTELIKEYCLQYKKLPDLTLAKKIFKEVPSFERTVDDIRSLIRYRRGHNGEKLRSFIKENTTQKPLTSLHFTLHLQSLRQGLLLLQVV